METFNTAQKIATITIFILFVAALVLSYFGILGFHTNEFTH